VNGLALRRVNVTVVVKADSQADAEAIVRNRMNEWFCDPALCELEADFGFPRGTLLHYTVAGVTGHRAVAA
jgi:hypothetical protein